MCSLNTIILIDNIVVLYLYINIFLLLHIQFVLICLLKLCIEQKPWVTKSPTDPHITRVLWTQWPPPKIVPPDIILGWILSPWTLFTGEYCPPRTLFTNVPSQWILSPPEQSWESGTSWNKQVLRSCLTSHTGLRDYGAININTVGTCVRRSWHTKFSLYADYRGVRGFMQSVPKTLTPANFIQAFIACSVDAGKELLRSLKGKFPWMTNTSPERLATRD